MKKTKQKSTFHSVFQTIIHTKLDTAFLIFLNALFVIPFLYLIWLRLFGSIDGYPIGTYGYISPYAFAVLVLHLLWVVIAYTHARYFGVTKDEKKRFILFVIPTFELIFAMWLYIY